MTRQRALRLAALIIVCGPGVVFTQARKPGPLGSSTNRAEGDPSAIVDSIVRANMAALAIPGASVVVMANSRIVKETAYGTANLATNEAVTPATAFFIASITKAFFGAVVLRLVEDGRLHLDDSIGVFLHELPVTWRGVTLRQLFEGTSGLPMLVPIAKDGPYPAEWREAVDSIRDKPVVATRGTQFTPAFPGQILLGQVIAAVTGHAYRDVVRAMILEPLGLRSAAFGDWRVLRPGRAEWYSTYRPAPIDDFAGTRYVLRDHYPDYIHPAAGLFITARDLANFIDALERGRVLGPAALRAYWNYPTLPNGQRGEETPSAWFRADSTLSEDVFGHEGGARAAAIRDRRTGLTVVVLTNLQGSLPSDWIVSIYKAYANHLYLQGVHEPSLAKPVIRPVASLPGVYPDAFAVMPNGRIIYYAVDDTLYAYDLTDKHATFVARGDFAGLSVSPRGDRIAFHRWSGADRAFQIWTVAVDPASGVARGSPQRVSIRAGREPRVSPDGKTVAFVSPTPAGRDLVVAPVIGHGRERVVAHFNLDLSNVYWTTDGHWLLVHLPATAGAGALVQRVAVEGGIPETLFFVPAAAGSRAAFDGTVTLFRADRAPQATTRMGYRLPNGDFGEFDMPASVSTPIDPIVGQMRRYTIATSEPTRVFTVNMTDGTTKSVAPIEDGSKNPTFSPDGKKLAIQTSAVNSSEITIVNTDGSEQHRFQLPLRTPPYAFLQWSPDSRRLTFWGDDGHALGMLDISTGATKLLYRTPFHVGPSMWTENSAAVRFWQVEMVRPLIGAVYELPIAGTPTRLRQLPPEMTRRGVFVSPSLMEYGTDSGEFVLPVEGGAPHRLPVEKALGCLPSDHGNWWVFTFLSESGRPGRIQVVNAAGDTSRVIDLPFEAFPEMPALAFGPDNRSVVMVGRTIGEKAYKLFSVPTNGTAPREVATLPTDLPVTNLVLARDGRTAAYTVASPPTTTVYELDLRPLIHAAAKQTATR